MIMCWIASTKKEKEGEKKEEGEGEMKGRRKVRRNYVYIVSKIMSRHITPYFKSENISIRHSLHQKLRHTALYVTVRCTIQCTVRYIAIYNTSHCMLLCAVRYGTYLLVRPCA